MNEGMELKVPTVSSADARRSRVWTWAVLLTLFVPVAVYELSQQAAHGFVAASYTRAGINDLANQVMAMGEASDPIKALKTGEGREIAIRVLRSDRGAAMVEASIVEYENQLAELIGEIRASGAVPIVAYIPNGEWDRPRYPREAFAARVSGKASAMGVQFWRLAGAFDGVRSDDMLIEGDSHLNPAAMALLASNVQGRIGDIPRRNAKASRVCGPAAPNQDRYIGLGMDHAWRFTTDANGFREGGGANGDGLRLLFVGDSVLMGPYIENHETMTAQLSRLADVDAMNAAVGGWGIHDQLAYFRERGHAANADAVIVCVTGGDLFDVVCGMIANGTAGADFAAEYVDAYESREK